MQSVVRGQAPTTLECGVYMQYSGVHVRREVTLLPLLIVVRVFVFRRSSWQAQYVVAAATSGGPATSRTLLLIGELQVVPPQQSGRTILIRSLRLRLTCTSLNVRCGLAVHSKINQKQETLKMFEFKARNIENGSVRNQLVPARKSKTLFLAPYARTTRYEEAFLPEGKKRPRSLRSLGLASL